MPEPFLVSMGAYRISHKRQTGSWCITILSSTPPEYCQCGAFRILSSVNPATIATEPVIQTVENPSSSL